MGVISTVKSLLKMVKTEKSFELFLTLKGSAKKKSLMIFYRHSDSQRYAALGSMPNPYLTRGRHIKCSTKFARQKKDVPSILLDAWQCAHNTDSCSTENRVPPKVAPLQLGQSRAYFTERKLRLHPNRRIPTRGASLKQHDHCVYRTCIQSLLL